MNTVREAGTTTQHGDEREPIVSLIDESASSTVSIVGIPKIRESGGGLISPSPSSGGDILCFEFSTVIIS